MIHSETDGMNPRARLGHQDSVAARGRHVDVADVDRAARERDEIGRMVEKLRESGRAAIRDDEPAAARGVDQLMRVELAPKRVEAHLAERLQAGERPLAVVVLQRFRWMRKEDARHALALNCRRRRILPIS
jgi:hypothetical protein